jgi:hypothetical protein
MGQTEEETIGTSYGWVDFPFTSPLSLAPDDYYLVVNSDDSTTDALLGLGTGAVHETHTYGSWPDPLVPSALLPDYGHMSIYATYTPTALLSSKSKYMSNPQWKIILTTFYGEGLSIDYTFIMDKFFSGQIIRNESSFDTGTFECADPKSTMFPDTVTANSLIQVFFKDASESTWSSVFSGIIKEVNAIMKSEGQTLRLICDGSGYGFPLCTVGADYGLQSSKPSLASLRSIITDPSNGIVPAYVNKILNGSASGYSYTADNTTVQDISAAINYLSFPYKPANKALKDLCDLVQAVLGASVAGPHWIVTTDKKLLVTTVGAHSPGSIYSLWPTYYGGSQTNATLEQGRDFIQVQFQKLMPEANHIIYYGAWRRPSNGDGWTEANAANWFIDDPYGAGLTLSDDATVYNVGTHSLRATNVTAAEITYYGWPYGKNAGWNLDVGTNIYIPYLNFFVRRNGAPAAWYVFLHQDDTHYWYYEFDGKITADDTWYYFHLPVGRYWKTATEKQPSDFAWSSTGSPSWTNINYIRFEWFPGNVAQYAYLDGLYFGDIPVCRVAKNSTSISTYGLRTKLIKDDVGKDDSLCASDDSGVIGQMAKAELLRCQTTPIVGTVVVPLLKDLMAGQLLHIHANKKADGSFCINKDMRVTRVTHNFRDKFTTTINLTDDIVNANAREAFTSMNTFLKMVRPDTQDRQATSMKVGTLDVTVPRLEKDYPS